MIENVRVFFQFLDVYLSYVHPFLFPTTGSSHFQIEYHSLGISYLTTPSFTLLFEGDMHSATKDWDINFNCVQKFRYRFKLTSNDVYLES
jgi:hypothetical protein